MHCDMKHCTKVVLKPTCSDYILVCTCIFTLDSGKVKLKIKNKLDMALCRFVQNFLLSVGYSHLPHW